MRGLVEHVSVKGGNVAPLHAAGMTDVEGSRDEVGRYWPPWEKPEGPKRRGGGEEEEALPRGASRVILDRLGSKARLPFMMWSRSAERRGRCGVVSGCGEEEDC